MLKKIMKLGKLKLLTYHLDKERKEHDLTYLFWECTMNCNFYCKHCGSSAGKQNFNEGMLSTDEIKKVFKDVADKINPKQVMVAVTGGEPLVRKDVFEVMGYAAELGFPWGIVTNGFLVTEDVVKKMKETKMRTVVVSIDGLEEIHDEFRGMKGAYKKAVNAVKLLAKEGFLDDLQITTVTHKKNIDQLEQMYEKFIDLGITSWRVMDVDPIGRAEGNKDIMLDGDDTARLLDFIKKHRKSSKIDVTYGCEGFLGLKYEGEVRKLFFHCPTGINVGSILYNGDIFVCPNVPRRKEYIQGNVRNDNFIDVWDNKYEIFRNKERTACDKCKKCMYWEECLGGSFHLWDDKKKEPKYCHLEKMGLEE